jgi:ribose-phosphate pyrophosphokinase
LIRTQYKTFVFGGQLSLYRWRRVHKGGTMSLEILSGSANYGLAEKIAKNLGMELTPRILERFPDGELHIEVQRSVRGCDVYLVQPTCPPVDEHFFELFLLADAWRRAGAAQLTAVIPYFGYASLSD